jgi:hypothetical protein
VSIQQFNKTRALVMEERRLLAPQNETVYIKDEGLLGYRDMLPRWSRPTFHHPDDGGSTHL